MVPLSATEIIQILQSKQAPRRSGRLTTSVNTGSTSIGLSRHGAGGKMPSHSSTRDPSTRYHPYQRPQTPSVEAWTIVNSVHTRSGCLHVTDDDEIELHTPNVDRYKKAATIDKLNLQLYADRFEGLYQTTNYREKIIQNDFWRRMYKCGPTSVKFLGPNGYEEAYIDGTACIDCGLILPLSHMTIDHQRPQSGGETEAIARLFRACDLTDGKPVGAKGKGLINQFKGVGLDPGDYSKIPKPARNATPQTSPTTSRTSRYTLSSMGHLIYAAIVSAGEIERLKRLGMHSLANLKPLCTVCNPRRSNRE